MGTKWNLEKQKSGICPCMYYCDLFWFGLTVFGDVFEKFCCSRVFRLYFEIFSENILKYLKV